MEKKNPYKNKLKENTIINTLTLVNLFGNSQNKKTYKKNKHLGNSTKNKLIKIAKQYCEINPLGKGQFEIKQVYDKPIHVWSSLHKERLYLSQFYNNISLFEAFYSYSDFCKLINLQEKTTILEIYKQLDILKIFIDFTIFDEPLNEWNISIRINKIYYKIISKSESCFKYISYPDYYDFSGIYKIYNDFEIYIGSTKTLYKRYTEHFINYDKLCDKTSNILQNNGVFEVCEFFHSFTIDRFDKDLQKIEYEYIKDYIFNYSVGVESRTLINKLIPDKRGNLINLGTKKHYNNIKEQKEKIIKPKYTKLKVNNSHLQQLISLMNSNNIDYIL